MKTMKIKYDRIWDNKISVCNSKDNKGLVSISTQRFDFGECLMERSEFDRFFSDMSGLVNKITSEEYSNLSERYKLADGSLVEIYFKRSFENISAENDGERHIDIEDFFVIITKVDKVCINLYGSRVSIYDSDCQHEADAVENTFDTFTSKLLNFFYSLYLIKNEN